MLNLIAAAMIAVAPVAPADAHAQHGQTQHGQAQQSHEQHKGMKCCEHMRSDAKMDCCKDMADPNKARDCCKDHGKGQAEHQHQ